MFGVLMIVGFNAVEVSFVEGLLITLRVVVELSDLREGSCGNSSNDARVSVRVYGHLHDFISEIVRKAPGSSGTRECLVTFRRSLVKGL